MVPNYTPSWVGEKRVALVGEAPGNDEVRIGRPFVGASGQFLAALMSRAGHSKDLCFQGNISQHRPPENNFRAFQWHDMEVQTGIEQLRADLTAFNPNIVVLLGNIPLKAAMDPDSPFTNKFKYSNANWRGSLFKSEHPNSPFYGFKCMATYHPAYVLRDYETAPLLQFDLRKAVRESTFRDLYLPIRKFEVELSCQEIVDRLRDIRKRKTKVAIDIEGVIDNISCISFATSASHAFIVPFFLKNGKEPFPPAEMCLLYKETALTLEDPEVKKVLQNCLYDRFVLQYSLGIVVKGTINDTMLKHWELYSELEKSLAVQASIYTDEPYWKYQRTELWQGK